jgi:hypothetical protein
LAKEGRLEEHPFKIGAHGVDELNDRTKNFGAAFWAAPIDLRMKFG